ncbi:hypothetical protein TNCV_2995991 [Trichonephila clavipes]|nr:hypothetical protein TNCV_2995991 [Trichonephila clavipes]
MRSIKAEYSELVARQPNINHKPYSFPSRTMEVFQGRLSILHSHRLLRMTWKDERPKIFSEMDESTINSREEIF